jgi:hypothetical protein
VILSRARLPAGRQVYQFRHQGLIYKLKDINNKTCFKAKKDKKFAFLAFCFKEYWLLSYTK